MRVLSLPSATNLRLGALGAVFGLIAVELLVIGLLYDEHAFDFKCQETAPVWFCVFAARIVPRALAVMAGMILFVLARPAAIGRLFETAGPFRKGLTINVIGFLLLLWPVFVISDASSMGRVGIAILSWSLGGILVVAGLMLILAPPTAWGRFLRENGTALGLLLAICLALPDFGRLLDLIWQVKWITDATFASVAGLLITLGYTVITSPEHHGIGAGDFHVTVGWQCSGVEGFLLITAFLTLYIGLYRRNLRFPHVLILYPLGLLVSWCFNVLRITVLLMIGIEGHPELAVGAFHSHAGWLNFTVLSLLLVSVLHMVPWIQAREAGTIRELQPFFRDPVVARILPFAVFMLSALLASTLTMTPGQVYPLRALAVAAVMAPFIGFYLSLGWRIDPAAVGVGAVIAVMWVVIPVEAAETAPYGVLSGALLVLWFVIRGIGTAVLVPIFEELFFRDYLEGLFRRGPGLGWTIGAALGSAVLFGALHDRWAEAFVAGLLFSWLAARPGGRITDAILAHMVANGAIFAVAFVTGRFEII